MLLQDCEVVQHLCLALGGAAQQVLEIKFNKVIGIAVFKEFGAVEATLCHRTHKFPGAQIAGAK